jgi:hypothetical protein
MKPQRSSTAEFPGSIGSSDHPVHAGGRRRARMKSIQRKPLRSFFRSGLALLGLTCCWLGTVEARSRLSPSEQFPGPWLEVTQEIRDVLTLYKVSACSQAMARQSSQSPDEYLLYCTRDEQHWTSWHVRPTVQKIRGPFTLSEDIPLPEGY